ncbi:dihydroneopterin aldolase [Longivirga aurantiaca]|uniref:7,8-dihydroneopterin aldolase n=1 Tax=Longivirga aurantiaca TaxID=1837743 RepID=A0ABW1SXQ8_9ACTN
MPEHLDRIAVRGLSATGHHGVFDFEKREGQTFVVDVVLGVDTREAAATDDLARTVHYAEVAADVIALIEGEPVDLIETLAQQVADACLARDGVEAVEVTVHKPEAPVGVAFGDVAVTITRLAGHP